MQSLRDHVGVVLAALVLLLAALPALAVKTVSTSDGVTLTLTDTGAFSSLTVDGNTAPTLAGVTGGFFIVPVETIPGDHRVDYSHKTYYAGTAVTGTATQVGADVHLTTSTIENHTFDIWIRGGLPYLKVEGTATGTTSNDKGFLMDFRMPVDANGWTWANRLPGTPDGTDAAGAVPSVEVINTSSNSNWYFARTCFFAGRHSWQTWNPYGTITRNGSGSGTANMGLSISPLLFPPQAYIIEYNAQTGFMIQFELGTTTKTTKHPNAASFYFTIYKHSPAWGMRSAVQRLQSFFPEWWNRVVSGGNWCVVSTPRIATPQDYRIKFEEGRVWTSSDPTYYAQGPILTMRYSEPWAWHNNWSLLDAPSLEARALDIPENRTNHQYEPYCCAAGNANGIWDRDIAQMELLSGVQNPDGTIFGLGDTAFQEPLWRVMTNPDPEIPNFRNFTPGRNRSQVTEDMECRRGQGVDPPNNPPGADVATGAYLDSAGGWWVGWDVAHNFNPNHWAYFDYSPGLYWNSDDTRDIDYGNGLVCMWGPLNNIKFMKYFYEQMRREGRPVIANLGIGYESQLDLPFVDVCGVEAPIAGCTQADIGLLRAIYGPKPVSFIQGTDGHPAVEAQIKAVLPFGIYPGVLYPKQDAEYEGLRSTYQTYMPVIDQLDAAIWRPITGAKPADTTQIVERFGPNSAGEYFFVLRAINAGTGTVTLYNSDLGWSSSPSLTITALLGAAPSRSNDGNGNAVLSFGSLAAEEDRVVKVVYSGTPTLPRANFSATPNPVAVNSSASFSDTSTGTPTSWRWSFGDGTTSTAQNPSHTYTGSGKYIVSLTVGNATGQDIKTVDNYLTVNGAPVANFAGSYTYGVVTATTQFRDKSTGLAPTSWSWTFGDGGTSTLQNPTHDYNSTQTSYNVTLTATNAYGSTQCTKNAFVTIKPIGAVFTATPTSGASPLAVTFTDQSGGTVTAWSWNFGDGNTSTAQSPSHTYSGTGYFTVSLQVWGPLGTDTSTRPSLIAVCPDVWVYPTSYALGDDAAHGGTQQVVSGNLNSLQADDGNEFVVSASTTVGCKSWPNDITFYSDTTYTPDQILSLRIEYAAHATGSGNTCMRGFEVGPSGTWYKMQECAFQPFPSTQTWLTADKSGSMSAYMDDTGVLTFLLCGKGSAAYNMSSNVMRWHLFLKPEAGPQPPVANFTGTPTVGAAPLAVSFTDTSSNSPTSWSWTFGDSSTSTAQNPSHSYTSTGSFTVALTATNSAGNNTNTKNNYITVGNPPVANFIGSPTAGAAPLIVGFTDSSTNTPTSWSWAFGDSSTSTAQNPSHSYAAGTYTVSLTAANAYGSDGETKTNYITATSGGGGDVYFAPNNWSFPNGDSGTLVSGALSDVATSNNAYMVFANDTHYQWKGMCFWYYWSTAYTPSQVSKVKVEYELHSNLANTPSAWLGVQKADDSWVQYATTGAVPGTSDVWFSWESTDVATYLKSNGAFTARLCACGYSAGLDYQISIDTARVTLTLIGGAPPVANFSGTPTIGAPTLAVSFTDSSTNTPTAWSWSFGDSNSSTVQNPSHSYTAVGNYTVVLTATNAYGNNTNTKNNYITVGNKPVANFSGTPTVGAAPLAVTFTDSSTYSPTAWSWAFGDSNTSTAQNPSHTYSSAGTYTVALTATNAYGNNTNTQNNYITAGNAPVANFSGTPTIGAPTLAVSFTDSSTNTPTAWSWSFGDSNSSTVQNPSHSYTAVGNYTVALTATNAYGNNTNTKNNYITVGNKPVANFSGTPTIGAAPLAVTFTDSSTYSPTAWSWAFGDSSTSTVQNPSHTYSGTGSFTVALTATNAYGNSTNTKTSYITVGNAPVANFSGTPTVGAAPLSVTFTDSSTNSPVAWSWTFGDSTSSTVQNPSHSYSSAGTYTVALTATNAYGNNTNTKNNYITVGNPPVANFSGTPTSGTAPLGVSFTDSSTNSPTSWSWNFGDSTTSTVQNPSHTYSSSGTYTVALTATNAYGNNTNTKTSYISVSSGGGSMPTFVAAGAVASGTGTITPALPSGIASNDILLLFLETANEAISITNQNGGTWTQVTNSPQTVGTAGGSNGTRLTVFWSRYNGTQGAPTASDSGNHQLGRVIAIRGATIASNPFDVTAGGTEATVDTSGSIAGATTTVANTLVIAGIATSLPDASGTANFSAWTNANLTSLTERTDNTVTAGNGGGLGIATGGKATAGAYGNTAVTCGAATTKAMMSIAIKPPMGTEVALGASTFSQWGYTTISGTLADTNTSNDVYLVQRYTSSAGNNFWWYTGYTPSQVSKIRLEYEFKCSLSNQPKFQMNIQDSGGVNWTTLRAMDFWTTTDSWFSWETTSPASYMQSNGNIMTQLCTCNQTGAQYDVSIDTVRVILTLN